MKEKIKQEFIKFGFTEEKSEEIAEGLLKGRKLGFATPKDSPKHSLILLLRKFNFEVNISKVEINPHFVIVTIKLKEDENGKIL